MPENRFLVCGWLIKDTQSVGGTTRVQFTCEDLVLSQHISGQMCRHQIQQLGTASCNMRTDDSVAKIFRGSETEAEVEKKTNHSTHSCHESSKCLTCTSTQYLYHYFMANHHPRPYLSPCTESLTSGLKTIVKLKFTCRFSRILLIHVSRPLACYNYASWENPHTVNFKKI